MFLSVCERHRSEASLYMPSDDKFVEKDRSQIKRLAVFEQDIEFLEPKEPTSGNILCLRKQEFEKAKIPQPIFI